MNTSMRGPAAAVLAIAGGVEAGTVRYIDDDAAPGGNGQSWSTAFRFMLDGLSGADPGDEIHVAQGTYVVDRAELFPGGLGTRSTSVIMRDGVAIRGGYAGQDAADPDARDIDLYETILSGDIGVAGDDSDNGYHVVVGDDMDATAVLDGFTITDGNADGGQPNNRGGGMYSFFGSPTVINCTFAGNNADSGGAMYNAFGSPTVTGCTFTDNTAQTGGAMRTQQSGTVVTGCLFEDNSVSSQGGAMVITGSSTTTVDNCSFVGNSAGINGSGGALHIGQSTPVVSNCTFDGNTAYIGGAVHHGGLSDVVFSGCTFTSNAATNRGGAVDISSNDDVNLTGCTFDANAAPNGGAIHNVGPTTMTGCLFTGNAATRGGGMYAYIGSPAVVDSTFDGNTAADGAAIYYAGFGQATISGTVFANNTAAGRGGAVAVGSSDAVSMWACTFDANAASYGGAVYNAGAASMVNCLLAGNTADLNGGGMYNDQGNPELTSCTFAANAGLAGTGAAMFNATGAVPVVADCILYSESGSEITGDAIVTWSLVQGGWPGDGNIDADPQFADPDNGDYRLGAASPAMDAGHNWAVAVLADTDLDGNPRFADGPVADTGCGVPVITDMGAYEFQGDPFAVKLGDITGDGIVGVDDFLDLLAAWGPCTDDCCLADLDFNGTVGVNDFLLLLAGWG